MCLAPAKPRTDIPWNARGVLGPFDDDKARALRARLLQRLNRQEFGRLNR
jgi:hypothetical protein